MSYYPTIEPPVSSMQEVQFAKLPEFNSIGSGTRLTIRVTNPVSSSFLKAVYLKAMGLLIANPDWYQGAHQKLVGLGRLQQDWDGYGSESPSDTSVYLATRILEVLKSIGLEPARILALADGGIGFYFSKASGYAGLECTNTGEVALILKGATPRQVETSLVSTEDIELRIALERVQAFVAR
jgi:hypothetical protein